jgi:hypothetical protein
MNHLTGPISEFPRACYITIWLNAFLQSEESLERIHDALLPEIDRIEYGAISLDLLHFLEFLKSEQIQKARVHLPVSGDLDGLIDTGEYLDHALAHSQAISLIGQKSFVLTQQSNILKIDPLSRPPKSPILSFSEVDRLFAEFIITVSESLEAFDLVSSDELAREWMISLDADISKLELPSLIPTRVNFLLGRLTRTLAIGQLAYHSPTGSASATKNSMLRERVEQLITKSRQYLSQVSNYHWVVPETRD